MRPNIPLLKKVLEQIERDPQLFSMDSWEGFFWAEDPVWNPVTGEYDLTAEECGTTRCVAGWAEVLYAQEKGYIGSDGDAYAAMYTIAHREGLRAEHYTVGEHILGVPSSWFCLDPGDIVGKIREVISKAEREAQGLNVL